MNAKERPSPTAVDRLLCSPTFGIPFFIAVVFAVFSLSFSTLGALLSLHIERLLLYVTALVARGLDALGAADWVCRFLTDGVMKSVSAVLAFLPQTALLFLSLSVLEECGYLARAARAIDPVTRRFGLSGHAVVPMLDAVGCNASAFGKCTALCNADQKRLSCALPLVPCGARLPVIMLTASLFEPWEREVAILLFLLTLLMSLCSAATCREKRPPPLTGPLHPLRIPSPVRICRTVLQKLWEFLLRAATVVLLSDLVTDLALALTPRLTPAQNGGESLLAALCAFLAPPLAPLGFADGRAIAALIAGLFAKESVASVLLLCASDVSAILPDRAAWLSFAVFSLSYLPCVSTTRALIRYRGAGETVHTIVKNLILSFLFSYVTYTFARFLSI
ncbi:MAG: ferrous iron transporter B [Clostridia bacterium]|nr:ferrous iron transporter B [Clostridia bacterium]